LISEGKAKLEELVQTNKGRELQPIPEEEPVNEAEIDGSESEKQNEVDNEELWTNLKTK
jgi:hypothetical protein